MDQSYYGQDGTLYVWTGSGYQAAPKIAASSTGMTQKPIYGNVSGGDQYWGGITGYEDWGHGITGDYALNDLNPNNWHYLSGDENSFNYLLKSDDKAGTQITYTRDGDYYNPTMNGVYGMDTNNGQQNIMLASILAAPLAVAGAQAGLAAGAGAGSMASPGVMSTYGLLDTSLALPGTTFASGVGAGAGSLTSYGILDGSVALPGTQITPYSPSIWSQAGNYLMKNPSLLKGVGTLAGGLLGDATTPDVQSGGPSPATNVPVPQMYGGNPAIPQFNTVGNSESERRMMQQYLPGLFGGKF